MLISPYVYPGIKIKYKRAYTSDDKSSIFDRVSFIVSAANGINFNDLISRNRCRRLVMARNMTSKILHERYGFTMSSIGRMLGGRDHSTIHHALQAHEADLLLNYKGYAHIYSDALKKII
jgi:chromosomal replication initiation ATPase DnaA